ncbi:hypothetical protein [Hyphomicrobium sp.]|uniref:hypothetical protein n=1 Tax=Hyphomicrobium sp. TaxID=82 RepID=UPI001E12E325|nr:hypothetical protein [Hyphomicrobium sp.]MBY0559859.1 hypothetical protein [Hyphomicrobium sp.]
MFTFPATVTSLADVPSEFQSLYELTADGRAAILTEGLRKKIEVGEGLQNALKTERRRADDGERALKAWKDLSGVETPEQLQTRLTEIEEKFKQQLADVDKAYAGKVDSAEMIKQVNNIKEELTRNHQREVAKLTADLTQANTQATVLQADIEKMLKQSAATTAIAEHKGNANLLKLLVESALKPVKNEYGEYVVRVIDVDGDERIDTDGKPMTPSAYVAKLKQDDRYAGAFEGDGATGSGARGGNLRPSGSKVKNPWKKDSPDFNLTEQMRIEKTDKRLADQLKAAAGVA